MMERRILKKIAITAIFFFLHFTLTAFFPSTAPTGGVGFQKDEDILLKAKMLIQDGDFEGAIKELNDVVANLKKVPSQKKNLAAAYYLLARVYMTVQMDEEYKYNLRMVFETYPDFSMEEPDPEMSEAAKKIKAGLEKTRVIEKTGKKKKKKFPVLLVAAGAVVLTVVLLLVLKKKKSDSNENYDTETLGIEWLDIPAGEFLMGDNFNEGWVDERPVHAVYLDAFKISKYEITFEQYDRFCEETSRNKTDDFGWGRGTRPVTDVSWEDASAFCSWLSQKTGKNIHLPSEAQWEKAARGTDQRRFPWGNTVPSCDMANYNRCRGKTMPVGSYSSGISPYGVHDMAGNVWEWCSDWYDPSYYQNSPGTNPAGPSTGSQRIHRGGSWSTDNIRSANRESVGPSHTSSKSGFRICLD
jgi:formylglycine-generating enzyme required for sulfatase activity